MGRVEVLPKVHIPRLHHQSPGMLRKAGMIKVIGRENLVAHFDDALARARELL